MARIRIQITQRPDPRPKRVPDDPVLLPPLAPVGCYDVLSAAEDVLSECETRLREAH